MNLKKGKERQVKSKQTQKKSSHLARNLIIVAVILIMAAFFVSQISQTYAFKNVQISLAGVSTVSPGWTGVTLDLELNMYNPGGIPASVASITYSVYANNVYLGNGNINGPISIAPGATVTEPTSLYVSYLSSLQGVWSIITSGGKLTWGIKGDASVSTVLGQFTIPFNSTI